MCLTQHCIGKMLKCQVVWKGKAKRLVTTSVMGQRCRVVANALCLQLGRLSCPFSHHVALVHGVMCSLLLCLLAGIVVRFMNGHVEGNGIRDAMTANNLIQQVCVDSKTVRKPYSSVL